MKNLSLEKITLWIGVLALWVFLFLISTGAFAQTWVNVGNGLQQKVVGSDTLYRFVKTPGAGGPFTISQKLNANTNAINNLTLNNVVTVNRRTDDYITVKGTEYKTSDSDPMHRWYTTGGFGGIDNRNYSFYYGDSILVQITDTGRLVLLRQPVKNSSGTYSLLVRNDTSAYVESAPDTIRFKAIKMGSTDVLDEQISVNIVTPLNTGHIGRGLKVRNHFDGEFGGTAIEAQEYADGTEDSDHQNAIQAWVYKSGTGHRNWLASVYAAKTFTNSNVDNYYGYYYHSGTGGATNNYSVYAAGFDPMYSQAGLSIGTAQITNSQHLAPLYIFKPYADSMYGITSAQAIIHSDNSPSNGAGGVLALGGRSGMSTDRYNFAFLKGSPENAGVSYAGRLSFYTGSGGDNPGETNSANYERAAITSRGNLLINSISDDGLNKVQVNGSVSSSQYRLSALNSAPSSAGDTGTTGEIRITATYIYICTATNTWVRAALTTW